MQSSNRKLRRVMAGLQNPNKNSSKVGAGMRPQTIVIGAKRKLVETYLTKTGLRLKEEGAPKKEYNKHRKNRYVMTLPANVRTKVIYHEE